MALFFKILPTMVLLGVASSAIITEPKKEKGHFRSNWPAYAFTAIIVGSMGLAIYSGTLKISLEHSKEMVEEFTDKVTAALDIKVPLDIPAAINKDIELSAKDCETYKEYIANLTQWATDLEELAEELNGTVSDNEKTVLLERANKFINCYAFSRDTSMVQQLINHHGEASIDIVEKAGQALTRSSNAVSKIQSLNQSLRQATLTQ